MLLLLSPHYAPGSLLSISRGVSKVLITKAVTSEVGTSVAVSTLQGNEGLQTLGSFAGGPQSLGREAGRKLRQKLQGLGLHPLHGPPSVLLLMTAALAEGGEERHGQLRVPGGEVTCLQLSRVRRSKTQGRLAF